MKSRNPDGSFVWHQTIEIDLGISKEIRAELFPAARWPQMLVGREDFRSHLATVVQDHKLAISVESFVEYWLSKDLTWHHEVLEVFRHLQSRGHKLFIATNQDAIRTVYLRGLAEVQNLFSGVFASSDLGVMKSNPDFFKILQRRLRSENQPVIFIDDSVEHVRIAEAVGFRGIHFDPDLDPDSNSVRLKTVLSALL